MKIKIKEMLNGLNKINYVNSQFVKINVDNDKMTLKTFSNYIKIQYIIHNIKSKNNYSIVINSKILNNLLAKINSEEIEIEIENDSLFVAFDDSKMTLNGLSNENFVDFNLSVNGNYKISPLNIQELTKISKYVQPYVLEDQNDFNKKLVSINCINILSIDNELKAFATDMKRLVTLKLSKVENKINYLIYNRSFSQVLKCLNINDQLQIYFDDKNLLFKTKETLIELNLVSLSYPNLQKIATDEKNNIFKINVSDLITKLERGNIISNNILNSLVYFSFQDNKVLLSFKNSEQGYAAELINYQHIKGEIPNFSISINFLLTALKNIISDEVIFSINDNLSPLFIHDDKNKELIQVVLPSKNIF